MIQVKSVVDFQSLLFPIIDVRSPGEYEESHIPGAINVPLLNNEHRHHIGVVYKMEGKDAAIALGHKLVDPIKNQILQDLKDKTDKTDIRVYCARGGLRSQLMSAFFSDNGYNVIMLKEGYKAYRNHAIDFFNKFQNILILSGYTGSGKTEVLNELMQLGEQVLDLEALANHRGSAFGGLGQQAQPSSTQFHNKIYEVLKNYDFNRNLWIENESILVGKVYIPEELWHLMKLAPVIEIDINLEERIKHTLEIYGDFDLEELSNSIKFLRKRLGDEEMRLLCALTEIGDLEPVVKRLLVYYDKAYEMSRLKRQRQISVKLPFSQLKPRIIAEYLQSYVLKNNKFAKE
ncbi:MAG: tRNA 2-selenouridine(34) synthase MnmH [Bacteroidia bacterium]|nr:tRNA 2-selenouridine(34) synthase MnmH [Bacteroidia bacterium]